MDESERQNEMAGSSGHQNTQNEKQDKITNLPPELPHKEDDAGGNYMALGMCLGMSLGMTFGQLLFDDMTMGMCVGMCIGMLIGMSIKQKK